MGRKNKSKRQGTQLQTQQDSGVFTGASPSSRQELAERLQDMRLDKAKVRCSDGCTVLAREL